MCKRNLLIDKFYEKIELSDAIRENFSKIIGKISKAKFEKHQLVFNPPMQHILFPQISEYNGVRDEYFKNETKMALPSQYSMYLSGSHDEVVFILVSLKLHVGKNMDSGH